MQLWFNTAKADYSIKNEFDRTEKLLKTLRYPSTNRLPRSLRHFKTWKANEYRITLLFAY